MGMSSPMSLSGMVQKLIRETGPSVSTRLKGPASILAFLPDKFSYQQVESLRLKNDMNAKGTAKMLRNWLHRGYIEKEESDSVTQKLSDSVYFKTHY